MVVDQCGEKSEEQRRTQEEVHDMIQKNFEVVTEEG